MIALTAIVIWPEIPRSNSVAFRGITAFLGLLISIGAAPAVASIIAGVVLIYMRSFKVGDWVEIAGNTGRVTRKSLLVTRMVTARRKEISIPNSKVLADHIVNYSAGARKEGVVLYSTVSVGYSTPWAEVQEALVAASLETPHVMKDPAPFVWQSKLGDVAVNYEINVWTDLPEEMYEIKSQLHRNIQDRFAKVGIEILTPRYTALRDGNEITIPPAFVPRGYEAPRHRINLDTPPPENPRKD
jgi:small-conductance mechanosensitive channel